MAHICGRPGRNEGILAFWISAQWVGYIRARLCTSREICKVIAVRYLAFFFPVFSGLAFPPSARVMGIGPRSEPVRRTCVSTIM